MHYYVVEIQKFDDGSFHYLVHESATRNDAESQYYTVQAAAAISKLPLHSAILFAADGTPLMYHQYDHTNEAE